ncbi:Hypothetical protein PMT_2905 [Prochlorococcus marinus str. MIT 9313]|uniref:Uncharacterized protein n=1 Tax=Prochlorococcus marinus (strain MIT 9313) TaxID=74547 RepID=B9ESR9_PROMM|nr:Hypothetical protein PMT_2905 [Prochlorococcus marinus str. MIT 9313]
MRRNAVPVHEHYDRLSQTTTSNCFSKTKTSAETQASNHQQANTCLPQQSTCP